MANNDRFGSSSSGGYGSGGKGFGRGDDAPDSQRGYGAEDYGGNRDERTRGFGGYSQDGSYGASRLDARSDERAHAFKRAWDHDRPVPVNRYGNDDDRRGVAIDETDRLIASNKVEGTAVYDRRGNRLGTIENFMVDKRSGHVAYAVLSFGGILGYGGRHYPLPWNQLGYDERMGGYVVDITERDLQHAPSHRAGDAARYDRGYGSDINSYYGRGRHEA